MLGVYLSLPMLDLRPHSPRWRYSLLMRAFVQSTGLDKSQAVRTAILLLTLFVLLGLKLSYPAGDGPYGLDGGNYFQIARHVADGDGLQTSISLYHLGLTKLPTHVS